MIRVKLLEQIETGQNVELDSWSSLMKNQCDHEVNCKLTWNWKWDIITWYSVWLRLEIRSSSFNCLYILADYSIWALLATNMISSKVEKLYFAYALFLY